jgi:salicylate hydroxylase
LAIAPVPGSDRHPIVIAGAGIGGLTAALAIARTGFRVVIAERSEQLSTVGAGIQIAPNAGRVLASLGLDKVIAAAAIEPAAIVIRDGAGGRTITSIPAAAWQKRYGFPYRVLHRADLQSILAAAATRTPAIRLQLGATVESSLEQPDSMLVRLRRKDGSEVVQAEAIIAADGVWSSHRDSIPNGAKPKAVGRTAWRALVPADVARSVVDLQQVGLWLGTDAHIVHYPVAQGAALNIVAIVAEDLDRVGWNAPGEPGEIAERFASWSKVPRDLLAAPVAWQKFAIATIDPYAPWTSGRLAVLGDAAHAMTPFGAQGAAMAIEDAAVIADSFYRVRDSQAALRAYEAERRPRVAEVAEASRRTGEIFHLRRPMAMLRNIALTVAGPSLIFKRSDSIYRWVVTRAER